MLAQRQLEKAMARECEETPIYVEAAVDWITATCSTRGKRERFRDLGAVLLEEQTRQGEKIHQVGGHGYRGHSAGSVVSTDRADTSLIQVSGAAAHEVFHEVAHLATNVTRLDVQVTAVWELETQNWATRAIQSLNEASKPNVQPLSTSLITTKPSGTTAYLGSKASDRRARIYDKTAESNGEWPANSWRWEVQSRREVATSLARDLVTSDDLRRSCLSYVHGHFERLGCAPTWASSHVDVSDHATRARTNPERRLRWLENQIGPVLDELLRSENSQVRQGAMGLIRKWILDAVVPAHVSKIGQALSHANAGAPVSIAGGGGTHAHSATPTRQGPWPNAPGVDQSHRSAG